MIFNIKLTEKRVEKINVGIPAMCAVVNNIHCAKDNYNYEL